MAFNYNPTPSQKPINFVKPTPKPSPSAQPTSNPFTPKNPPKSNPFTPSAGGSYSSSSSNGGSSTTSITPQQIVQVQEVAKQEKLQQQINQQQQAIKQSQDLQKAGLIASTMKSSYSDNVFSPQTYVKTLESQQRSVAPVDLSKVNIKEVINRSGKTIWGGKADNYIAPETAQEIINQKNRQIILDTRKREVGAEADKITQKAQQDISYKFEELQTRVNSGTLDVETANKILKGYVDEKVNTANTELQLKDKQWWDNRGKSLDATSGKMIGNYKALKIWEKANIPNTAIATGIGIATGAVIGGGLGLIGAFAGQGVAKSVGTGLFIVGTGATAVTTGATTYNLANQYKTGAISKGELVAELATGGIFLTAGIGGAMVGSLGVKAITDYSYLNKDEKIIADRILNRQDAIKVIGKKGTLSETEIKQLKITNEQKLELIRKIRTGQSIQKLGVEINKQGLTPAELKIVNKLNYHGEGYRIVSQAGEQVKGGGLFNTEAGRGIARFNPKLKRDVASIFTGKSEDGMFKGMQYSEIKQPILRRRIFNFGQETSKPVESRLELIKSKGKAKYFKEDGSLFRAEYSTGESKLVRVDVFNEKGQWFKSTIKEPIGVSRNLRVSKLVNLKGEIIGNNPPTKIRLTKTGLFEDVSDIGYSGKPKPLFNFEKSPSPRSMNNFRTIEKPTASSSLELSQINVQQTLDLLMPESSLLSNAKTFSLSLMDINPQPTYVGGVGGVLSQSLYYEKGSEEMFPLVNGQEVQTRKVMTGASIFDTTMKTKVEKDITFQSLNLGLISPVIMGEKIQQKQNILMGGGSKQIIFQSQIPALSQQLQQKQIQQQKLQQKQIQQPIFQTPTTTIPINPTKFEPFFGLPSLGSIPVGGGQKGGKESIGGQGKTAYNPSLGAVLLRQPKKKVTKEEYALLSSKKYSGLSLRPEIEIVSSKKRKGLFSK